MHRFRADIGHGEALLRADVVQMRNGSTIRETLLEMYDQADPGQRLGSDLIVLRLPVEKAWQADRVPSPLEIPLANAVAELAGGHDLSAVFARASDRPVHILASWAGDPVLSGNLNPNYLGTDDVGPSRGGIVLDALRDAELDHMLKQSRAILSSPPNATFRAPSGRLVDNFVRVGNLQYDRDAIDAVSFWLLPHLKRCRAILTDTWSISSIALNTARLAERHFGGPFRQVEFLPDYLDRTQESDAKAGAIVARLIRETEPCEELDEVLCLVSATQSGSMRQSMDRLTGGGAGGFQFKFVAIFALGETEMPSLRDLSKDGRFKLLEAPDATAEAIPIDRTVYFPLLFRDVRIALNRAGAEASRQVIDAFADHGIVQIHRDLTDGGGRRHRSVHLKTERLLQVPLFVARFDALVDGIAATQIRIVASNRPGCAALARHAYDWLAAAGRESELHLHDGLTSSEYGVPTAEEQRFLEAISGAGAGDEIVVVVDGWQQDDGLSKYERFLRSARYQGRVNYIVGVAWPADLADWQHAARRVRAGRHTVEAVLEVPLPNGDQRHCPWCAELRLFQRWDRRSPAPAIISERMRTLARGDGLPSDELMLRVPRNQAMTLGPDSFFVHDRGSQADAYAGLCSALQRLRTRDAAQGPQLGPRRFPISTVLKDEDYLRETYTDSLLRASFLRGAVADELVYADAKLEGDRTARVRALLMHAEPSDHDLAAELLLAAGLGKATVNVDEELTAAMASIDRDAMLGYMLDMIVADAAERPT